MPRYMHLPRLLTLLGLVLGGLLLTSGIGLLIKLIGTVSNPEVLAEIKAGILEFSVGETRVLLIAQHVFSFILPAYLFFIIFYKSPRTDLPLMPSRSNNSMAKAFDLQEAPGWVLAWLGILFLIAAYPLVNLSFMLNETFPLPDWAINLEEQARGTMEKIIQMPTPWIFLFNMLIISILPGIGEELIFRGILQKELGGLFKSPVAAIWISAFIFSAIHFQLEGLLPRMVLGVVLGYLYYWTNNLWIPIIVHAFNNGMQVMLIYFTGMEIAEVDKQTGQLEVWMIPLSIAAMYFVARSILKNRRIVKTS